MRYSEQVQKVTHSTISNALIGKQIDAYRSSRAEQGVAVADREWMRKPLQLWMQAITVSERVETPLKDSVLIAIAVGINETLPIRDALIVSLLCPKESLQYAQILRMCYEPFAEDNIDILVHSIDAAFTDPTRVPDKERCKSGLKLLQQIVKIVPICLREQPLAIMSYVSWWLNDTKGLDYASQAIELNKQCTLASIIASAYEQKVRPAWVTET